MSESNSTRTSVSISPAGSLLIYEDRDAGVYRLAFTADRVEWECIEGAFVGESGTAEYRAASIDADALLIVWSQTSGEAVVMALGLTTRRACICHIYGAECNLIPAKILAWTPPSESDRPPDVV
jgi:hypothetical protein